HHVNSSDQQTCRGDDSVVDNCLNGYAVNFDRQSFTANRDSRDPSSTWTGLASGVLDNTRAVHFVNVHEIHSFHNPHHR
ncbi:hypothetical protein MMC17_000231, partial [Xylographa soralifera]|nr:hypothetical protein [Xylographa soralifera]